MKALSKKSMIAIGFFLVLAIFSSSALGWYYPNEQYRKSVTVDYASGSVDVDHYEIDLNISIVAGMHASLNDINFTWINTSNSNAEVETNFTIWAKASTWFNATVVVPKLRSGQSETLYMYYGNTTVANSASNASRTFIAYLNWTKLTYSRTASNPDVFVSVANKSFTTDYRFTPMWQAVTVNVNGSNSGHSVFPKIRLNTTNALWFGNLSKPAGCSVDYALPDEDATGSGGPRTSNMRLQQLSTALNYTQGYDRINSRNWSNLCSGISTLPNLTSNYFSSGTHTVDFLLKTDDNTGTDVMYANGWSFILRQAVLNEPTSSFGSQESNNAAPSYSNIRVNVTSPIQFPSRAFEVNITWNDTDSPGSSNMSEAWISADFTGSNRTYNMTRQNATEFYYRFSFPIAAGTYTYTFYGNDSAGSQNNTQTYSFVINKAPATFNLSINGSHTDVTHIYPNSTNATAFGNISGANVSIYLNGTLVNSSTSSTIVNATPFLAANYWNWTATFAHQNYSASQITRLLTISRGTSSLSISVSPSTTVAENQEFTVTCSSISSLTKTLRRDGISVSNPFTASLGFGNYNFTCTVPDSANYTVYSVYQNVEVTSGGFGCSSNTSYAFNKLITTSNYPITLNFTSLVSNFYVKSDLSDVYSNSTGVNVTKNLTNGYYLVVNNTTSISSFTVWFGNYIISNNWTNNTANYSNNVNISEYSQISPYYSMTIYDELTGTKQLPPDANTTMSLYCTQGVSTFNVSHTKFLVSALEQLDSIRATVEYSASELYYRDYIVNSDVEDKLIYLVNANDNQVLQNIFKLDDRTGDFGSGTVFRVKKYLEGSLRTITELPFDIEFKAIAFLVSADKYQIFVDNGVEERSIGNIYTDPSSLTKNIVLQKISAFNISTTNVSFALTMDEDAGTISFYWNDSSGLTVSTEFWVYNATDGALLYYSNSTNRSVVNFVYTVPDTNASYIAKYRVKHDYYGLNTEEDAREFKFGRLKPTAIPILNVMNRLGANLFWFIMFFMLPILLVMPARYAAISGITFVGVLALLNWWNGIPLGTNGAQIIAFCLLLVFLMAAKRKKRDRE